MTARVVVSCDGHRHGQPCRGALPTSTAVWRLAIGQAYDAGWGRTDDDRDLCPSRGHDEEHERSP